jgi:hypothetical protein
MARKARSESRIRWQQINPRRGLSNYLRIIRFFVMAGLVPAIHVFLAAR